MVRQVAQTTLKVLGLGAGECVGRGREAVGGGRAAEGGSGRGRETVGGGREQREGERDRGSEHLSTVWKENIHLRVPFLDGDVEEVDEPGERVLVHGVNVGQVRDGEEEDRAVGSHWLIPCTRLLYLALCLLSNLCGGRRQSHVLSVFERSHFLHSPPPASLPLPPSLPLPSPLTPSLLTYLLFLGDLIGENF